ncbi:MAG TPA: TIGR04283 family arsenosugar biosynthesis glycosyltransferase [Gemmatimonadaceae bacterium]|nr:TIGR04283 family arsenosugar biosynthesis glycosyltransferase [Gemmatimonadaceae bacterium]
MGGRRRGGTVEREVFDGSRVACPRDIELSVIIPALDEGGAIGQVLEDLRALPVEHEVIVVDGGSRDATRDIAREHGARVIEAPRGRAVQLAAGARAARAPLLCFLHADVRLDHHALLMLQRIVRARPRGAYAFRLRIDERGPAYRLIEWEANARAKWAHLPRGDHGLVVWREDYERAGGYPELPVMEDVALVRALGRITRVRTLPATLRVSPRRWMREGVMRGAMRHWMLLTAFLAGASPDRLAERWRPRE